MRERTAAVQKMIDWIEEHLEQTNILENVSREVGYSPWYCSVMFHDVTGMTLKSYAAGRRLTRVTEEIRDTDIRILDLAVKLMILATFGQHSCNTRTNIPVTSGQTFL